MNLSVVPRDFVDQHTAKEDSFVNGNSTYYNFDLTLGFPSEGPQPHEVERAGGVDPSQQQQQQQQQHQTATTSLGGGNRPEQVWPRIGAT